MQNSIRIPRFSYIINSLHHQHFMCILANDDVIDKIDDLDDFYKVFGYTIELAKAGIGAEEFIWDNYVKEKSFDACLQMHIVDYLNKHSAKFRELYGEQYERYLNRHVAARDARGSECYACQHKQLCKDAE